MPDTHLKFSPSGSSRWLECPASLNHDHKSGETNDAAREGTAAHKLMERCWLLGIEPASLNGQEIEGYEITDEMAQGVQLMLATIEAETREGDTIHVEKFLQMRDDFGGTADCLIERPDGSVVIIDFKYGFRTVEVKHNTQLLCYGVLTTADNVRLVIVQPRAHHEDGPVRSWDVPPDELDAFRERVFAAFKIGPSEIFHAGDHCVFCPRKVDCPELYQLAVDAAKQEFADPRRLTLDMAAEILKQKKAVKSYFEGVKRFVHGRLEQGEKSEVYKLVDAHGHRRWIDEEKALKKLGRKYGKRKVCRTQMMSPAQLEKLIDRNDVNALCERPLKGTTVVPVDDRRPAVERKPVSEEFDEVCV